MNELRRWLEEEPPPHVRRLLEVGQWERPSGAVLERALGRGGTPSTTGVQHSPMPAERAPVSRILVKSTVVGVLLLGAGATLAPGLGMRAIVGGDSPHLRRGLEGVGDGVESDGPPKSGIHEPVATIPVAASSLPVLVPTLRPERSARVEAKPTTAPLASNPPASSSRICRPAVAAQIELLEQARSRIRSGQGAAALAILDRYDRFGAGRCFVLESLKHRMDAHLQTGNRAAAKRVATTIETRYPDTAQAREAAALNR